jgi:class 3 adenylate cyclase/tetratricopeptide (TPR) repeat protein
MPWRCADCRGENPGGTRFCGHCGRPREAAAAAPDVQATVADVAEAISTALSGERGEVVNRPLVERLASARGAVEERRLITAVFADVSGFTALAHGLDEEQLVGIIGPIVSRLADIVTRYGGYVGKFAGDAILAFFGAPVSHEDDAVRALLAAQDMQRESAELFRSLGPEAANLTLHVGVNTGYVIAGHFGDEVRMEYSVLGDAVNVAQRLESAAPGGAVYVGRDTYLLARSHFVFEDLGGLQVKGKPEPVPAWRLAGEAGEAAGGTERAGERVVGRSRELALLSDTLTPVAGGGGVAGIVGEPGRGKSALIGAARRRGLADGLDWVETHCAAYRSRPYRPYVELLRMLTEIPEDVDPHLAAARMAAEAERVGVPETAPFFVRLLGLPAPPGMEDGLPADPLVFRQGLHAAMAAYLVARAERRPLVLGIEDVHWADSGTLDLTRHLAARSRTAPFSLVLTARPEGRDTAAGLVEGHQRSALLDLGPLDATAVAELAQDVLGGPASGELAAMVAERTSGNPLFAQQLLRSLLETEVLERGPEGWGLPRGWRPEAVPTAVEQVLAARIDVLPRPAADLLQVASVIGRTVLPALLRQVAAGDPEEHDSAVAQLLRGGFLVPLDEGGETRYWFHHALLVDVAYGRLLRARRRQLHRETVAAITELYGTGDDVVDMLARHAHGGEMGRVAMLYLERAGARAEAMFANEQAVDYLRPAIEIAGRDAGARDHLVPLLLRCAAVEETRGSLDEALALYRRAEAEGGGLDAVLGQASTLRKLGDYPASLAVIAAARAVRPELGAGEEAPLAYEEGWILALLGRNRDAAALYRSGLVAARSAGDRRLEARMLVGLARCEQSLDDDRSAAQHARQARDLFEAEGDLPGLAFALRVLGGIENDLASTSADPGAALAGSLATMERAREIAGRIGNAEEEAASLINMAVLLKEMGRLDEALRCDAEAIEAFARVGIPAGVACGYCNLADHLEASGRYAEARDAAGTGLAVATEIGNRFWITGGLNGIAQASLLLGDHAEAARRGEEAFDIAAEWSFAGRAAAALRTSLKAMRALGDRQGEARMLAKAQAAQISPEPAEVAG